MEAAQVDYEALRTHMCEQSRPPAGRAAARFARRGLTGLIAWPPAEPVFVAELVAAARPAWTPHQDSRVAALAVSYQFLLDLRPARIVAPCSRCGGCGESGAVVRVSSAKPTAAPSARSCRCCTTTRRRR